MHPGMVILFLKKVTFIFTFQFCLIQGELQKLKNLVIIIHPVLCINNSGRYRKNSLILMRLNPACDLVADPVVEKARV